MSDGENKKTNMRWWEFYAVRYAMGTVIGGVLFFGLAKLVPSLSPIINDGKLEIELLPLLAAYGLTFCYLASAPILVLHAARFAISPTFKLSRSIVIFFVVPIAISITFLAFSPFHGVELFWLTLAVLVASFTILGQFVLVHTFVSKNSTLYDFYKALADTRATSQTDIIESYRHLREHGNSFAIVLCEILLAGLLYAIIYAAGGASPTSGYVESYAAGLLLLWILPASLVWLAGTLIERRFSGFQI
jgi:hypothetical protein